MTPSRIHYRNLPQLFLKAREELMCHFRPIINHHGLTEQQWRIMRVLSERDQLEPWEICDICQILSPSLAGVLARMDDMGVITRSRVPEDQRRVLVRLSSQGEALVEQMAPLIEAQYKLIEESLGTELLQDVYRVLDRVVNEERPPIKRVELPSASPTQADAAPKRRARRKST